MSKRRQRKQIVGLLGSNGGGESKDNLSRAQNLNKGYISVFSKAADFAYRSKGKVSNVSLTMEMKITICEVETQTAGLYFTV